MSSCVRPVTIGLVVALVVATAACREARPSSDASQDERPSPAASPEETSALLLRRTQAPGPAYVEGSIVVFRIRSDGEAVRRAVIRHAGAERRVALGPGRYTVEAAERPCVGSCPGTGRLGLRVDPPVNECRTTLVVEADATATVAFRRTDPRRCRLATD